MSERASVVCGLGSTGGEPALRRSYELARERDLAVAVVHAVDLPHAFLGHADPSALSAGRTAALDRLAPYLAEVGGRAALERDLEIAPAPASRALVDAALAKRAARLVLGGHEPHGLRDLFNDTTRGVLAHAPCPVWVQNGPLQPVRRILAALDPGAEGGASTVLALAREEARAFGAELELVHVFELPELGTAFGYRVPLPLSVVFAARETAEKAFDALLDACDWEGLTHERTFLDGDPRRELLRLAAGADLVVLGTHGRGAILGALLGSVASAFLRESHAPLLIARLSGTAGD